MGKYIFQTKKKCVPKSDLFSARLPSGSIKFVAQSRIRQESVFGLLFSYFIQDRQSTGVIWNAAFYNGSLPRCRKCLSPLLSVPQFPWFGWHHEPFQLIPATYYLQACGGSAKIGNRTRWSPSTVYDIWCYYHIPCAKYRRQQEENDDTSNRGKTSDSLLDSFKTAFFCSRWMTVQQRRPPQMVKTHLPNICHAPWTLLGRPRTTSEAEPSDRYANIYLERFIRTNFQGWQNAVCYQNKTKCRHHRVLHIQHKLWSHFRILWINDHL